MFSLGLRSTYSVGLIHAWHYHNRILVLFSFTYLTCLAPCIAHLIPNNCFSRPALEEVAGLLTRRGARRHCAPEYSPSCTSWSHAESPRGRHRRRPYCATTTSPWRPALCACWAVPWRSGREKETEAKWFRHALTVTDSHALHITTALRSIPTEKRVLLDQLCLLLCLTKSSEGTEKPYA